VSRTVTAEQALRGNAGLRALNVFVAAAAGDDAPAVMAARAERAERTAAARAAQASGADLESWLDEQHQLARTLGVADVEHLHPRATIVGGALRYVARSGPDYRGVLRGGGALAVEAKSAGRHRLALRPKSEQRGGVQPHQAAALTRCVKLGGVALLVVRFRRRELGHDVDTTYAVPWEAVSSAESIGPDDVEAWAVGRGLYLERWAS
jgi:hypothetical protein